MNKIKFCKISELSPGKSITKKILARRIAVFNDNGEIFGMEADCKHMKAPLDTADIKDGVITCNWHQWKYELKSGKCLTQKNMDLRKYEVEVDGDDILIVLG